MRIAVFALFLMPAPVWADVITVPSQATQAVIYATGGTVTHDVTLTVPAGRHELILPDLPQSLDLGSLRISAPNLVLGSVRYRNDFVPPRDAAENSDIEAAKARIDAIEAQIQDVRDEATRLKLAQAAAEARISFLSALGGNEALPSDPAALAQVSEMIGTQVLAAREAVLDADIAARAVLKQLKPLQEELAEAQAALDALVPETEPRAFISVQVTAEQAVTDAPVSLRYFVGNAYWQPAYDLRLSDDVAPTLTVVRTAVVAQQTGENWEQVALTLSTQQPLNQIEPGFLPEDRRRLIDPELREQARAPKATSRMSGAMADAEVVVLSQAESAVPGFEGLSVVYDIPSPVDVASGADFVRVPFDELSFDAELVARAVPIRDGTAYLMARFKNESDEPLLASDATQRYFDGALVGTSFLPPIAAGEEVELGFGPIEGLQLNRTVLNRAEGDRGIISRSNEQSEDVRITLENLTSRRWQVELLDRVPYSEQEDLEITYSATPAPDVRGVEDRRGILQWNIEMDPGDTKTVETSFTMTWPDGQIVR